LFKILDEIDKAASNKVDKTVPAKRGRKKAVPLNQPLIRWFARRGVVEVRTESVAKRARLGRKEALEEIWRWRKEACRLELDLSLVQHFQDVSASQHYYFIIF
jgi:hypothetical protein